MKTAIKILLILDRAALIVLALVLLVLLVAYLAIVLDLYEKKRGNKKWK